MPKEKHNLRITPASLETNNSNPAATPFHTPSTPTTPSSSSTQQPRTSRRSKFKAFFHRKPKSYSEVAPAPRFHPTTTSATNQENDAYYTVSGGGGGGGSGGDWSESSDYTSEPPTPTTPGLNDLTLQLPNLSLEDRDSPAGTPTATPSSSGAYAFPPSSSSSRPHLERSISEPVTPTEYYARPPTSLHSRIPSNLSDASTGSASGQSYRKRYTIIWDLGDTLLRRKVFGLAKSVSISDFAKYTLYDWQNPFFIKNKVFDILDLLDVRETKSLTHLKRWPIKSEGRLLPACMLEWLAGVETGHNIMKKAMAKIKELENTYLNEREVRILENSVKVLFDPVLLSTHMRPIEKMVKILDMCHNSKYVKDMLILSNWDNISFNELYKMPHVQQVFKYFKNENIVVSANINMIKPDPDIYTYVLKRYGLKADECIVIDDDENNLNTAASLGFHVIKVVKGDYGQVYRRLVELRALPNPKRRGSIYPVDEEPLTSTYTKNEDASSSQQQHGESTYQQQAVQ